MTSRPADILLVEDSPSDAAMTVHALREGGARHRVRVVGDGEDALAFLHRRGRYAVAPRPDLILLDLNLPRVDGRDVLAGVVPQRELDSQAAALRRWISRRNSLPGCPLARRLWRSAHAMLHESGKQDSISPTGFWPSRFGV